MAIWYRAHQNKNLQNVFSGDGGLFVAGRWNYKGRKVIYCSQSIALATMEWLSHNGLSVSGFNYFRYIIEIPENMIIRYSIKQLPTGWDLTPATDATRDFADSNLFSKNAFAISVPSVLVPEEMNLIINPLHPDFFRVAQTISSLGMHTAPNR